MRVDVARTSCQSTFMEHWNELRTALVLAREGTVSAAAELLGVHRATVNRHIDLLEASFGAPLFQRHARGYTLTETGQQMLEVAGRAEEMFDDLAGRSRARQGRLSGKLVVTSLSGFASLIMPALQAFRREHPEIALEFVAGAGLARLEYGEAHVAFRAGPEPQEPYYVVQRFTTLRFGLYAGRDYIGRHGQPDPSNLADHAFVGHISETSPLPYAKWLAANIHREQLALTTASQHAVHLAIRAGLGLGFLPEHEARHDPHLTPVPIPSEDWSAPIWTVTHVDLHRTEKIQEFLKHTRQKPKSQQSEQHG